MAGLWPDYYADQRDDGTPAATSAPGAPQPSTPLVAGPGGRIDPVAFARRMTDKVAASPLNGYVPNWGPQFGITTGSPSEWSRLFTMIQQQESGHRVAPVNADGSLQRFASTLRGEQSYGPGQFNVGEYGLKNWGDVNNPDRVADAYINVATSGNMFRNFGSMKRPGKTLQHAKWFDNTVAPNIENASYQPPAPIPPGQTDPTMLMPQGSAGAGWRDNPVFASAAMQTPQSYAQNFGNGAQWQGDGSVTWANGQNQKLYGLLA